MRPLCAVGILVGLGLLPSATYGATWGRVKHRCEGETTVYYSRIEKPSGSWEKACRTTRFPVSSDLNVRFKRDAGMACTEASCDCQGRDCSKLVAMKCVHRGVDGMWAEVRVSDSQCRSTGRWGAFRKEACARGKADKFVSRIHVTRGDWKRACENTAAQVNSNFKVEYETVDGKKRWTCEGAACLQLHGTPKAFSAQCVHRGADGMWLEAYLERASCPIKWEPFARTCPEVGMAKYQARLLGVPDGVSWEKSCENTPADYNSDGIYVRPNPEQCVKDLVSSGMWARFEVPDQTCVKKSFDDGERVAHCTKNVVNLQQIWTPRLEALQQSSSSAAAGSQARSPSSAPSLEQITELARKRYEGKVSRGDLATRTQGLARQIRAAASAASTAPRSATRGKDDRVLIYTVGGSASAGAFFGLSAEQGIAAWFDARENARAYTTFAYSTGAQFSASAEGVFGIWTVDGLNRLGGDAWGCSIGVSAPAGPGATFTAWYDYENNYLGSTLAPGVGVGAPVQATLQKVHTFVY